MAKLNRDPLLKRITADRARWRARLQSFSLRFHVLLIVVATGGFAALVSRVLLEFGMTHLGTRYAVVVAASYVAFCGLVRLWIEIVRRSFAPRTQAAQPTGKSSDVPDVLSGMVKLPSGGGSGSGSGAGAWAPGRGGDFAGGGASGSFEESAAQMAIASSVDEDSPGLFSGGGSGGGSGGSGKSSFDLGDLDGDAGIALLALFALLAVLASAVLVVLWIGPGVLVEAGLAAFVTTGLARRSMFEAEVSWLRVVIAKTWWIAVLILIAAVWAGTVIEQTLPGVRTAGEAIRWLMD